VFLLAQYAMAGVMGTPLRGDFDWIIDTARTYGLLPAKTKNVTQLLLETSKDFQGKAKDAHRYGLFAGATGMNVSPTFSATQLIPDHGLAGRFPYVAKPLEILGNLANVGGKEVGRMFGDSGSTEMDRSKLVQSAMPPAGKGFKEMMLQDKKTGFITDPNHYNAGVVHRGPPSLTDPAWLASAMGTNTIKESEMREAAWQTKLREEAIDKQLTALQKTIINKRMSGMNTIKEIREYVKLGGDERVLENAYTKANINKHQDVLQRARGIPKNVRSADKYNSVNDLGVSK